jgi:hypothetical protein
MEITHKVWLCGSLLAARWVIAANFPDATNLGRMPGDDVWIFYGLGGRYRVVSSQVSASSAPPTKARVCASHCW